MSRGAEAPTWKVWTALGAVYIVWGSTYLAIKVMVETMPPLLSSGARFVLAGTLLAAFLAVRGGGFGRLRLGRRELLGAAVVGVLMLLGGNGLVAVGEEGGMPSGLVALLIASEPLFIVLLRALDRDRPTRRTLAGVIVGFAGVALLLAPADQPEGATIGGTLLILGASACWAAGSFTATKVPAEGDPLGRTAWQMLAGGVVMTLVALTAGEAGDVRLEAFSLDSVLALAYLVIFGSLVAFTAYQWLLRHAPISKVSTYAYVNPVVAVALGALILSEEITVTMVAGAAIVLASVATIVRHEGPDAPVPEAERPASLESPPDAAAERRPVRLARR